MNLRRTARCLIASLAVLTPAVAGFGKAQARAAEAPTVLVSPSTNLADGQAVKVTGSGFSAGAGIALIECKTGATSEAGCDTSTLMFVPANNSGSFSTNYIVSRYLQLSPTVDCAVAGSCGLAAANEADTSQAASVPLAFNPSAPPPPTLSIGGSLSATGTVNPATGVAKVSGVVTCNRAVAVDISGQLSQIYKRFIFRSTFFVTFMCRSTVHWKSAVQPTTGLFGVGKATITATIGGSVGGTSIQINRTRSVALSVKKK